MPNELRPIGMEFTITYPPSPTSTDTRPRTVTWRVKAHVLYARFLDDKVGEMGEEHEMVKITYGAPKTHWTWEELGFVQPERGVNHA